MVAAAAAAAAAAATVSVGDAAARARVTSASRRLRGGSDLGSGTSDGEDEETEGTRVGSVSLSAEETDFGCSSSDVGKDEEVEGRSEAADEAWNGVEESWWPELAASTGSGAAAPGARQSAAVASLLLGAWAQDDGGRPIGATAPGLVTDLVKESNDVQRARRYASRPQRAGS
jgi:hypothetical protein